MFFDDPKNVLSVARTHQEDLLRAEQRDRLARQTQPGISSRSTSGPTSGWQVWHSVIRWLQGRLALRAAAPARERHHLPN
jgi:hypothetical protein